MANILSKGLLFPPELTSEMFSTVRGKSSLAKLSASDPIPFNGKQIFTFALDKEVDLVAENGPKSNGGATVGATSVIPVKVEYGVRISDEFKYSAQDIQLQYLAAFADGFAKKVARGIDIMAIHGVNPRTGTAATQLATNNFDTLVTQSVTGSTDGNANVEAAVALVQGSEYDVTGMAMAPAFRSTLAAQTRTDGTPLFPELGWGADVNTIHGLPVDVNSTVSFNGSSDLALVGNFRDFFRWGYARDVEIEMIEYGNPDNDEDAGDLKGHNQVYLRGEAYIGWAVLAPDAFAKIVGE